MKPHILSSTRLGLPLATAIAGMLALHSASAETYYWDKTDPIEAAGFGSAGGTWGVDAFWSLSSAGTDATGFDIP